MNGYAGEILRINLTKRKIRTVATRKYEAWVGGHGMGAAIFWDLIGHKVSEMQDGYHPDNVMAIMTSPLTGTLVPACAGRIEMVGVGVQSHPIGWFTRSNMGGRFATMLKHAGWDGIVIEGAAKEPVWLDIRDKKVELRNCEELSLWGQDAWETQHKIWDFVAGKDRYGNWVDPRGRLQGRRPVRTTRRRRSRPDHPPQRSRRWSPGRLRCPPHRCRQPPRRCCRRPRRHRPSRRIPSQVPPTGTAPPPRASPSS